MSENKLRWVKSWFESVNYEMIKLRPAAGLSSLSLLDAITAYRSTLDAYEIVI